MQTFRQSLRYRPAPLLAFLAATIVLTTVVQSHEPTQRDRSFDFESLSPGKFTTLTSGSTTLRCTNGVAEIDDKHAARGKQCLRLHGAVAKVATEDAPDGASKTVVVVESQTAIEEGCLLTFRAERWTKRPKFVFRIEQLVTSAETNAQTSQKSYGHSKESWTEIYNGDREIRVGRGFLSEVSVALLESKSTKLRLTCESPPATGILIDDVKIASPKQQTVLSATCKPLMLPLVRGRATPFCEVRIETDGSLSPMHVHSLTVASSIRRPGAGQVDLRQIEYSVRQANSDATGGETQLTPNTTSSSAGQQVQSFRVSPQSLRDGENSTDVECRLPREWSLDQTIALRVKSLTLSNGRKFEFEAPSPRTSRPAVALRDGGDDGVHTFRIPGLVTTNQGTLLAVYDIRHDSGRDLPGNIDVGLSRSLDGGESWEKMQVIMDMGDDSKWRYDGIGDPSILVDQTTGTIWVAATWSHGNRSWHGSGPGLSPEETGQLMLVRSDDDGRTWSEPINITGQVKAPEWSFLLQGPGRGITMQDGTLVFPAQYQDPPSSDNKTSRLPHSTIIYSRDHGSTWHIGTGAFDDTTESQVAEIEPGLLMLNCRYNRASHRVVMTSRDMGYSWQEHSTSRSALIEPRACMASLLQVRRAANRKQCLLFSNPLDENARQRITIQASLDGGMTWPVENRVLLDERRGAGYSCMTMIDDDTVGILYEGSQAQLTFQRVAISELIDP